MSTRDSIAVGAFGRAFYLAVVTGKDYPISDSATQLLTALGSALVGGAVGYISGTARKDASEHNNQNNQNDQIE